MSANSGAPRRAKTPIYHYMVWLILTICFAFFNMGILTVSSLNLTISESLGCSSAVVSIIHNGTYIPVAIFSLFSSTIAVRLGNKKKTILAGIALIAVSGVFFLMHPSNILLLVLIRILQGVGTGLMNVFCLDIAPWFPRRQRAFMSGLENGMYGPAYSLLTVLIAALTARGLYWSTTIGIFLIFGSLLCAVLVFFFFQDMQHKYGVSDMLELPQFAESGGEAVRSAEDRKRMCKADYVSSFRELFRSRSFWLLAVPVTAFGTLLFSMGYIFPLLIPELGFSGDLQTLILSLTFIGTIIAAPLGGILCDRFFVRRRMLFYSFGFIITAVFMVIFLNISHSSVPLALIAMISMVVYCGNSLSSGTMAALPAEFCHPDFAAGALGIIVGFANLGGIALTAVAGVLRDVTGSIIPACIILVIIAVIAAVCSIIYGIRYQGE